MELYDKAVHKNSYKSKLYELISSSLSHQPTHPAMNFTNPISPIYYFY
jgi:hypothetical protein